MKKYYCILMLLNQLPAQPSQQETSIAQPPVANPLSPQQSPCSSSKSSFKSSSNTPEIMAEGTNHSFDDRSNSSEDKKPLERKSRHAFPNELSNTAPDAQYFDDKSSSAVKSFDDISNFSAQNSNNQTSSSKNKRAFYEFPDWLSNDARESIRRFTQLKNAQATIPLNLGCSTPWTPYIFIVATTNRKTNKTIILRYAKRPCDNDYKTYACDSVEIAQRWVRKEFEYYEPTDDDNDKCCCC